MFNITIFNDVGAALFYFEKDDGPTVQMEDAGDPENILFERTSESNGEMGNYTWMVQPTSYIEYGDELVFTMPSPIFFTPATECYADYWLVDKMECRVSGDLSSVTITIAEVSQRRRLASEAEAF